MPTYPYKCVQTGETRDITASIKSPPPECFEEKGKTWHRVWISQGPIVIQGAHPHRRSRGKGNGGSGGLIAKQGGAVLTKDSASRSLPRRKSSKGAQVVNRYGKKVLEYPDGSMTNMNGQPIVDSQDSRDRELKRAGFKDDDSSPDEVE